jgi:hypothetical protein
LLHASETRPNVSRGSVTAATGSAGAPPSSRCSISIPVRTYGLAIQAARNDVPSLAIAGGEK